MFQRYAPAEHLFHICYVAHTLISAQGKSLMQSIPDSILALESVTLSTHSELCRTASVLMDTYFGENNEGVEQDMLA